jgi:hypothetical protein
MVTICTTKFKFKQKAVHAVYSCVLWGSKNKARLITYTILVYVTETESVYCADRAKFLYSGAR